MQGNNELLEFLGKINTKKPYGTALFNALARVTISLTIDAVCLRLNIKSNKVEVYLTQRANNDTAYPGQWHCPNSIFRPSEDYKDVFARLEKREIGGLLGEKNFIDSFNNPQEVRGHFFSLVYLCSIKKDGLVGRWFSVNDLPKNTIVHHRNHIIPMVLKKFRLRSSLKKNLVQKIKKGNQSNIF
ncbi:MAG: hypothetical protein A3D34_02990 [Candidatus Staskawiczbacteria bacterium RIFCSPHIGHO2_02_FULL_33_16]|uniref:Nudix hydrolase domain-containing protein n=1 Tax=Candidatus Staskawiczbacteria bacterium RIFCSPHIGHO2_02_FULL_33_16 TaxID=1802204 RepID=A0A1G2HUA7_9BACT|nr:MAG: hypothetical protein A3D34_02990 [Candidatus Staskawiczbacteria bacterium RIFCSPHIGHO2_02_FULL_33_16]